MTGRATYAGDVQLPGQLAARVVRSSSAHGHIVGIDVRRAASLPGVVGVFTSADLGAVPTIPVRIAEHPEMAGRTQPVLATDRVRYVGEPVAVVVAEDPYVAEDAADLVQVDIDPLPAVVDPSRTDGAPMWADGRDNLLGEGTSRYGDIDAVLAEADLVLEEEVTIQRHTGLPMETRSLVASWVDEHLEVWGPTKYVHFTRKVLADSLGLPLDAITLRRVAVGGMFGVRGEVYPEDVLVAWLARHLARPVGWVEDRVEHLVSTNHARDQRHRFRLAVRRDGQLLGFTDDVVVDVGAYPRPIGGRVLEMTRKYLPGPYAWRAFSIDVRGAATTKTPVGTMRGPAAFEATFARERLLDRAARELGIDPLELRRRNLVPGDAMPHTFELEGGESLVYDSGDYAAGLECTLSELGYDEARAQVATRRGDGELAGTGIALFIESSGGGITEAVTFTLDVDGGFTLGSSAADIGQGIDPMIRQVVRRAFGVDLPGMAVSTGTTEHAGGTGTYGSRTTIFVGSATADAANHLLDIAKARAADKLDCDPTRLEVRADGLADGEELVHWKELAPIVVEGTHDGPSSTVGFGAHVAQVRVDPGTGHVTVERLGVSYDAGVAIDAANVSSQLEGASIQALGGTLLEELAYDEDGQPGSTTFIDYLVPTALDAPDVEAVVLELGPAPGNPLGAKGAGEAGMIGVAAAVANAVADAIGGDGGGLVTLPLKADAVVEALDAVARDGDRAD